MDKILIIGASGHAKVIIDIIEKEGKYEIFGLLDSYKKEGNYLYNYKILGTEKDLPELIKNHDITGGIIAIGDNYTRMKIYLDISSMVKNFNFINAIHPSSVIGKNVVIQEGTVIMPGVIINSDTKLGKQCIVNTNSSIGHDCIIKDFTSIAPGVTLAGGVKVAECTAISLGASVLEMVKIGKHTVIGASALVNRNIGSYKKAFGVPAKEINDRKKNDKYLGMLEIKSDNNYELGFYSLNTDKDINFYNDLLNSFKSQNIFYSLAYCNYKTNSELNYFVLKKNNIPQILLPIYLHKIESHIFDDNESFYDVTSPYGYSGPLFDKVNSEDLKIFWNKVDEWYKENNVVTEFLRFNLEENHRNYSGHLIPTLYNVKGEILSYDTIWENFKQKVRNNYRKAEKNNLSCIIYDNSISDEIIDIFYDIYIKTMQRNAAAKTYFYPKDYFKNLIRSNSNSVLIAVVYQENIPISVELILINNNTLYSYLGGTLAEYFGVRPNDFLKIEVVKWAIKNGKRHYILGGGRTDNDGLYQYKKSFFPKDEDVIFYTGRKVVNEKIYNQLIKEINVKYIDVPNLTSNSENFFPLYKSAESSNINNSIASITVVTAKGEWEDVLNKVESFDFYHTYDYHRLSIKSDEKALLIKYEENGALVGLPLVLRKISGTDYYDATSVYGYAGPIQKNIDETFDNKKYIEKLNVFFKDEKIISVFSRLNPFIDYQENILKDAGTTEELGNIVNIDLTKDVDEQRTIFSKTTKRYINKCRKTFELKFSSSEEDILMFMNLYYENMDRVHADEKYYFSKQYFLDFVNSNDYKTDVLFAIDKESKEVASAALMVKTNNIIQYHISGTRNDYLNISPIRFLINEMRIKGTQEGYKYFNLGGGLGNQEDELFRFKSSFSKDFRPFKVWRHIANKEVYNKLVAENNVENIETDFFPLYRYKSKTS